MDAPIESSNTNTQIARAAGIVMLAIILGQVLGLVRGILVARAFAPADLDAFFAANRVSETLFMLIAAGALGSAFIPTFTGLLARGDRREAWRLVSSLANLVLITLSVLAALAALVAPAIVRYLLAPGFSSDPRQFQLTIDLLRIQLLSVVFFGMGGLLVGVLNAHQVFFVPALAPSMYQIGLIFGVLGLAPSMGIRGLAWGVAGGAILYLALQIPSLVRLARRNEPTAAAYSPTLGLGQPSVREVLRLMVPRVLGIGVVQMNFWVNTWLASRMQSGSVAGLQYGFSLMLMAQAAIAQSVAIAAMPTFASQHALGQIDRLRSSLAATLRGVLLLSVPAMAGLILLRHPIVELLYQRGEFDARMTELVSWALLWYAVGLVGHSLLEVLTRAFYAQHDTRTPVIVGAAAMTLNGAFSLLFSAGFDRLGSYPHGGLALANSVATALEMAALYVLMRRRLGSLEGPRIGRGLAAAATGTVGLIAAILPVMTLGASAWITTSVGVVVGVAAYAIVLRLLRVPEFSAILAGLRRKVTSLI